MASITKYDKFLKNQLNGVGVIDFDTDTLKLALVTSAYVPAATTHDFFDDITNEVTGTGYTAGGVTLTGVTLTETAGTVKLDADNVTVTQSGAGFSNARYGILYKSTGTAGTSPLFAYIDFVTDVGNVASDLSVNWNAAGISTWT